MIKEQKGGHSLSPAQKREQHCKDGIAAPASSGLNLELTKMIVLSLQIQSLCVFVVLLWFGFGFFLNFSTSGFLLKSFKVSWTVPHLPAEQARNALWFLVFHCNKQVSSVKSLLGVFGFNPFLT